VAHGRRTFTLVALVTLSVSLSHRRFQGSARATPSVGESLPLTFLTTPVLHLAFVGEPYEAVLRAEGRSGVYRWTVTSGGLPRGLRLDPSTAKISGKTEQAGKFSFTITVADSSGGTESKAFQLEVFDVPFDKYGGFASKLSPKGASDYFRVERLGSRFLAYRSRGGGYLRRWQDPEGGVAA
jgi:hypothetical protein